MRRGLLLFEAGCIMVVGSVAYGTYRDEQWVMFAFTVFVTVVMAAIFVCILLIGRAVERELTGTGPPDEFLG